MNPHLFKKTDPDPNQSPDPDPHWCKKQDPDSQLKKKAMSCVGYQGSHWGSLWSRGGSHWSRGGSQWSLGSSQWGSEESVGQWVQIRITLLRSRMDLYQSERKIRIRISIKGKSRIRIQIGIKVKSRNPDPQHWLSALISISITDDDRNLKSYLFNFLFRL